MIQYAANNPADERFAASTSVSKVAGLQTRFEAFSRANIQNRMNPVPWQQLAVNKLNRFLRFAPGWDGHNAPAITAQVAMFTLQVLETIMSPDVENPMIVPSSCGGVQIEWHKRSIDLEILISGPHVVDVYFKDRARDVEEEFEAAEDFSKVKGLVNRLAL